MISCVLLSAGQSLRFGSPKALAVINVKTAIETLQEAVINSVIDELIVVLGAQQDKIKPYLLKHNKVKFVYNKDYNYGQTSSFKAGVASVSPHSEGIFLLPVDFPWLKTATLNILANFFRDQHPAILIPSYQGKKGHPPLFETAFKKDLLDLDNTVGLNVFEHSNQEKVQLMPVNDAGIVSTFNTPEELAALKISLAKL